MRDDFSDPLGGLHVDYAFAAAVGEAVFVGGSALAESVFGDRKDQVAFHGYVDRLGLALSRLFLGCRSAPGFVVVAMPTT